MWLPEGLWWYIRAADLQQLQEGAKCHQECSSRNVLHPHPLTVLQWQRQDTQGVLSISCSGLSLELSFHRTYMDVSFNCQWYQYFCMHVMGRSAWASLWKYLIEEGKKPTPNLLVLSENCLVWCSHAWGCWESARAWWSLQGHSEASQRWTNA